MRRQQDIIHFHKRATRGKRLDLEDIQSGSRQTFGLQRLDQRLLLDDGSARGVDKHGGWFHQSERIGIHQMVRR